MIRCFSRVRGCRRSDDTENLFPRQLYSACRVLNILLKRLKSCETIRLNLCLFGSGQDFKKVEAHRRRVKRLTNVTFHERVPYEELPLFISNADICIGIFGDTPKTQRVIPNKIYEYLAMHKPIITADTPAIRELLTDAKNVVLCKTADGEDLARKIRLLQDNHEIFGPKLLTRAMTLFQGRS
jgi:glycosyltransferase involved in cell wall biosynthesis